MRTNYVLIDYENVQPKVLNALEKENFKVYLFVGALQSKITFEVADAMQRLGSNATYVKISKTRDNALDFLIAFYIGHIAATDPSPYFHIISKDTDYDSLIDHLTNEKKFFIKRWPDINDIPLVKIANCPTVQEKLEIVVATLNKNNATKPRVVKTLSSHIHSIFKKALSDEEVTKIIKELEKQKIVTVTDGKVSYSLPEAST